MSTNPHRVPRSSRLDRTPLDFPRDPVSKYAAPYLRSRYAIPGRSRPLKHSRTYTESPCSALLAANGSPILNITKKFGHRKFDIRQGEGRNTPTIALVHTHKVGPGWDISTTFSNANDGMALTFKLSTENKWGRYENAVYLLRVVAGESVRFCFLPEIL